MAKNKDNRDRRAYNRAWSAANREKRKEYMRAWRNANREAIRALDRAWRAANLQKSRAGRRHYYAEQCVARPFETAYLFHQRAARQRGIPFLLTFEEWLAIWQASGKWEERGRRKGQYVMARTGDVGPYAADNVRICTVGENVSEAMNTRRGKPWSKERRERFEAKRRHRLPAF